jgi:hypothetical protein
MTTPQDSEKYATKGSADVSPPDSEERRQAMAEAVKDAEEGQRAELYDTNGENNQP